MTEAPREPGGASGLIAQAARMISVQTGISVDAADTLMDELAGSLDLPPHQVALAVIRRRLQFPSDNGH